MLSDLSRLEERRVHTLQSCKNSVVFQFSSHRYRSLIDALFQLLAIYVAVEVQSRKNDVSICLVLPVFVVVFGCQLEFMSLQSRCILTARYMNSSVLKKNYFFSTKEYLRNCFIWFEIYFWREYSTNFLPIFIVIFQKKMFQSCFPSPKLTELHVAAFQLHQIFFHCLMSDFLKRKNEEATKELTLPVVAIY